MKKTIIALCCALITGCAVVDDTDYCKLKVGQDIEKNCSLKYTGSKVGYINDIIRTKNHRYILLQMNGQPYLLDQKKITISDQNLDFYSSVNTSFKFSYGNYDVNIAGNKGEANVITKLQLWG